MIVHSTIDLAHNLGLQVVAEGVENSTIMELLKRLGCDTGQGYYLAKPMSVKGVYGWLKESRWGQRARAVACDEISNDVSID